MNIVLRGALLLRVNPEKSIRRKKALDIHFEMLTKLQQNRLHSFLVMVILYFVLHGTSKMANSARSVKKRTE